MITLITVIHVIVCLVLIMMILLQAGKGNGLAGAAFTGSSEQSVFGTKTADVMTKTTAVSAVLFLVTCISLSAITAKKTRSLYTSFKDQAPITMNQVQKAVKEAEAKAKTTATSTSAGTPVDAAKTVAASAAATVKVEATKTASATENAAAPIKTAAETQSTKAA